MNVARRSFARAFRWLWPRPFRNAWDYLDFAVAVTLLVYALTITALIMSADQNIAILLMLWFSLTPSYLLLDATVLRMVLLAFMGFPCGGAAYAICDIRENSDTFGILHATHAYVLLLIPYGILRAVILAIADLTDKDDPREELEWIQFLDDEKSKRR